MWKMLLMAQITAIVQVYFETVKFQCKLFLFLFIFNAYDTIHLIIFFSISVRTDNTTDPENVKVNPPDNTSNVTPDKQLQSPKKSLQPKPKTKKEWGESKCNKSY